MQRNDCVLTALGSGQYNDLLHQYYLDNGAISPQINDAEYEFLIVQGATPAQLNDMWVEFLQTQGYEGSLSDMLWEFWCVWGGVGPQIDSIIWVTDPIDDSNQANASFTMYYDWDTVGSAGYSTTISGGTGADIERDGFLSAPGGELIIGSLDCSVFDDGLVTATVVITVGGILGPPISQTVTKTTTP